MDTPRFKTRQDLIAHLRSTTGIGLVESNHFLDVIEKYSFTVQDQFFIAILNGEIIRNGLSMDNSTIKSIYALVNRILTVRKEVNDTID